MRDDGQVTRRLKAVVDSLVEKGDDESLRWVAMMKEAMYGKQTAGGLSGWANMNDSKDVETLQADFDPVWGEKLGKVWTPGIRNAVWNPFGVRFFTDPTRNSDRRFHGVHTVASHDDIYVGWDSQNFQVVVYHLVVPQ